MTALATGIALTSCATAGRSSTAAPPTSVSTAKTDSTPNRATFTGQPGAQGLRAAGNPYGDAYVPSVARAADINHPNHVIGSGTPASCTSEAVVQAVAEGGVITFDCGPQPVNITMTATAKVVNTSHRVVLDGKGLITLNGSGKRRILYMNTCDKTLIWATDHCNNQQWPQLIIQNMTFKDGYSAVRQTRGTPYGGGGGGAIYAEGGQLKVVNSRFVDNRCYKVGPDLGGAAIRAVAQWSNRPIYITSDTFSGGVCSNGGALSSIDSNWDVFNSIMTGNRAIGWGANPAKRGTPGGGSGGAIYNDGNNYSLSIDGTVINDNTAREGGGAIFFVVDNNHGTLTIKNSTVLQDPSREFWTVGYPSIFFQSTGHPIVIHSRAN